MILGLHFEPLAIANEWGTCNNKMFPSFANFLLEDVLENRSLSWRSLGDWLVVGEQGDDFSDALVRCLSCCLNSRAKFCSIWSRVEKDRVSLCVRFGARE